MARISNYAKIQQRDKSPKPVPHPIANGEFEIARGQTNPISRENYIPSLHGETCYYRNTGNKHILSRGF